MSDISLTEEEILARREYENSSPNVEFAEFDESGFYALNRDYERMRYESQPKDTTGIIYDVDEHPGFLNFKRVVPNPPPTSDGDWYDPIYPQYAPEPEEGEQDEEEDEDEPHVHFQPFTLLIENAEETEDDIIPELVSVDSLDSSESSDDEEETIIEKCPENFLLPGLINEELQKMGLLPPPRNEFAIELLLSTLRKLNIDFGSGLADDQKK